MPGQGLLRGVRARLSVWAALAAALACLCPSSPVWAEGSAPAVDNLQPGLHRTDLQVRDLSIPGWQTVQSRVDFDPQAVAARHKHPGDEIAYVLKGSLQYRLDGEAPVTLNAGDSLFIPTGKVHAVINVGPGVSTELATYVVPKDKPLVTLVK